MQRLTSLKIKNNKSRSQSKYTFTKHTNTKNTKNLSKNSRKSTKKNTLKIWKPLMKLYDISNNNTGSNTHNTNTTNNTSSNSKKKKYLDNKDIETITDNFRQLYCEDTSTCNEVEIFKDIFVFHLTLLLNKEHTKYIKKHMHPYKMHQLTLNNITKTQRNNPDNNPNSNFTSHDLARTDLAGTNEGDKLFFITEEKDFWNSNSELQKIYSDCFNKLLGEYTKYSRKLQNFDLETLRNTRLFIWDTEELKKKLTAMGLKQTYDKDARNIKLIFYNTLYRTPYFNTAYGLIKNNLDTNSLTSIKYKDFLYQNLVLLNDMNHNFLPFSIIICNQDFKANKDIINKTTLDLKFEEFYSKYNKKANAIMPENYNDGIYIARPVEFIKDFKYTSAMGYGIVIIRDQNDIDSKVKPLFEKFNCIIISKFLNTKLIPLKAYNYETKTITSGKINYSIRIYFLSLVAKAPGTDKYELWQFIQKQGNIMTSNKFIDTNTTTNTNAHNDYVKDTSANMVEPERKDILTDIDIFDTHFGIYNNIFENNDANDLNRNFDKYFAQIVKIVREIGNVEKYRVKIYPDCEYGFEEFAIDLILSTNDILYLAEVNNKPTVKINDDNKIMDLLNAKQAHPKYGFSDMVKKEIFDAKKKSALSYYDKFIPCITNGIISPIINEQPIVETDKPETSNPYYHAICITDDLAFIPRLKDGNQIPIK